MCVIVVFLCMYVLFKLLLMHIHEGVCLFFVPSTSLFVWIFLKLCLSMGVSHKHVYFCRYVNSCLFARTFSQKNLKNFFLQSANILQNQYLLYNEGCLCYLWVIFTFFVTTVSLCCCCQSMYQYLFARVYLCFVYVFVFFWGALGAIFVLQFSL